MTAEYIGEHDFKDGVKINSSATLTSVSTGTTDNDKIATQGYVDDNIFTWDYDYADLINTPSESGDVSKVGTPVDNQVGVWTGDGTIEGTTGLTYSGTLLNVTGVIKSEGFLASSALGYPSLDFIDSGNGYEYMFMLDSNDNKMKILDGAMETEYFILDSSGNLTILGDIAGNNLSGTNTGDNAVNTLYSGLVSNATHTGEVTGATALTITSGVVDETKLNSSVNDSLDLADSALQPGNNISELTNDSGFITPSLSTDLDFNNYKSIAMACDNGVAFPTTPVTAQWFYRTDIDMLFIYEAEWKPIISYGDYNVYVDGTNGDDTNDGYSSATAVATIQKAWDKVASISGGNVIIYIEAGTYNESIILGGKSFSGSYSITFQGEDFSTITPSLTGTASSFTAGVAGTSGAYPAPASLTDTANLTGVDYTGYFFEPDDTGVYKVIAKNDDDILTINDITYSSITNYKLYTLTTIIAGDGLTSNMTILPGQFNLYFNHIKFTNTITQPTIDQVGSAFSRYEYCQVQGGNNTRGCKFTNTTVQFDKSYVYNTYNGRSCIASEQGTVINLTSNVFYNSGSAGYGLRVFGPAFVANGGDMSYFKGSGNAYYAARLGGGGVMSMYRVYMDSFTIAGVFCAHEGFLLYESEKFAYAENITYKTIYGRSASNAPIGWSSEIDIGDSGTSLEIDWVYGNKEKITLTGNCVLTFEDPANGVPGVPTYQNGVVVGDYQLKIVQDATGGRTITWPSGIIWDGGSSPTLNTDASAVDIINFYYDGTNYYGKMINTQTSNSGSSSDPVALSTAIRNLIRELEDRAVVFTGNGGEWGEAYVDADGRLGSVDTDSTLALFDTNKYKHFDFTTIPYVIITATSISAVSDFAINDCLISQISSGNWLLYCTTGTTEVKRAQIYKTLFYGTDGSNARASSTYLTDVTAMKTSVTSDVGKRAYYRGYTLSARRTSYVGTFSNVLTNTDCSSWSYAKGGTSISDEFGTDKSTDETDNPATCKMDGDGYATTNFAKWYNPTDTLLNSASKSGTTVCDLRVLVLCDGELSWVQGGSTPNTLTEIDFLTDNTIPEFTEVTGAVDSLIVHTLPSGAFSSTISSCLGTALIADWEAGADIQYKLTNDTEDTGWLDYNEVSYFTAFTSEPTTCIVKLIPKTTSPITGFPSIKGFGILEL